MQVLYRSPINLTANNGVNVKVLKKGRSQKGWAKEFNCTGVGNGARGCDAKLLVEFNDLFITASTPSS